MATRCPSVLNLLRIFWVFLTFWCEIGIFYHSAWKCNWPDSEFSKLEAPTTQDELPYHILLVADPQILDERSYPGRPAFATYLSRLVTDLNLRKSWRMAIRKEPDAVVFLGDMMDGGRSDIPDDEYEQYHARFRNIFPQDSDIPQLFIPGNHDTGLGRTAQSSTTARYRYLSHFGDFNTAVSIANHTLVLLDAPNLVEEDYKRSGAGVSYKEWKPIPGGSLQFVHDFATETDALAEKEGKRDPVVLLTHIPLYRPDGSSCGPLREKGTIRPGVGIGYQNTLGKSTTQLILETIQPSVVFSGDDHDYCEYRHKYSSKGEGPVRIVREVSIKSISMAMGIRRPGFQLLSLAPAELTERRVVPSTFADTPCFMPDQIGIYLKIYIPLLIVSLLILFISNTLGVRRNAALFSAGAREERRSSRFSSRRLHIRLQLNTEDINDSDVLLPSVTSPSKTRERPSTLRYIYTRTFGWIRSCFSRPSGKRTIVGDFLRDIRDVAMFPIGLFVAITWFVIR
ncbi:Metallo-dependent phosphatase-like protein [Cyathus striatus]|nr:Metallo-dependent phosphatase-like protein [Cyathus striatus]